MVTLVPEVEEICLVPSCGHHRADHYTYLLNNREASCCRTCDPMSGRVGDHALTVEEGIRSTEAQHEFAEI